MKRKITYLTALLCLLLFAGGVTPALAGDVYIIYLDDNTVTLNGTTVANDLFTVAGSKNATKYKDGTWNGHSFSTGLKLDSSGKVTFTTSTTSTITVVQSLSTNGTNRIKFGLNGGTTLANNDNRVDSDNVGVHTFTDQAPGEYTVAKGNSESGIFAIKIEYTGAVMTKLDAPTVTYNNETCEVTITDGTNVKYTTDGTNPTEDNGTVYTASFTVEDGTTVKAASIGDGETTLNSDVITVQVLKPVVTIATPTATSYNGTVVLACATAATTLKYSVNGGEEKTYTKPFTLLENGTVNVTASRDGCESVNTSIEIAAASKGIANKTIYIGIGSFTSDNANLLEAKEGDGAEGCTLQITGNLEKALTSGVYKITTPSGEARTSIKLSNGAQNTLTLPAGINATRITFYSFINQGTRTCGWKEVAGVDYTDYAEYAMGTPNPGAGTDDVDIRTYPIDNANSITFTNAGEQLCFIIAVDVIDPTLPQPATISAGGYTTFCPLYSDVTIPAGVTAYTAAVNGAGDAVELTAVEGGKLPKGCGVVLAGTAGEAYEFTATTDAAALDAGNQMVGATTDIAALAYAYALGVDGSSCFFGKWNGTTFPAGKAYLSYSAAAAPTRLVINNGGTTGISEVTNAKGEVRSIFNLAGQKVGSNYKGIVIKNGKKVVVK